MSIEKILLDAKRIAERLKDREAMSDALLVDTDNVNKQVESMKQVTMSNENHTLKFFTFSGLFQFQDDIEVLNKLARGNSNTEMITVLHQENPQIREIQRENRQLKVCIKDHQVALEHIMTKYREHTQREILRTKLDYQPDFKHIRKENEVIQKQAEKIQEMAAVMQRAITIDEEKANKENEILSRLITENKGLRELLEISQKYGSYGILSDDKATQTDNTISVVTVQSSEPAPITVNVDTLSKHSPSEKVVVS
jgi:SIKE family